MTELTYKLAFMNFEDLKPGNALEKRLDLSIGAWHDLHSSMVEARSELAETQSTIASRLGITQPAVSVFENSNSLATQIGTIISYAAALGFELEFSLKRADYPDLPQA